jgi:3-hydroxyisobutyrate dehydrogenase
MNERVAVLGTGIMGHGMALALLHAGCEVAVWNRTPEKARRLAEDGARVAASVGDAVAGAEVVLTMLYDGQAVLQVAGEFQDSFPAGAVWLQTSTVGAEWMARLADLARSAGLPLLDAPVLGTKQPAEKGELTALVSGPADLIERAGPVLSALTSKVVRAGGQLGAATALKLACNAWLATITAGLAQSLALAKGQGLDPALFLQAIDGSGVNMPYAKLKGGSMLAGEYPAAFTVDNLAKDLGLIDDAAANAGVDASLLDALRARFTAASEAGHGAEDIAAVYTSFGS